MDESWEKSQTSRFRCLKRPAVLAPENERTGPRASRPSGAHASQHEPLRPGIALGLEKFQLRLMSQGKVTSLRVEHSCLAVVPRLTHASRRCSHGFVDLFAHRSDLGRGVGGVSLTPSPRRRTRMHTSTDATKSARYIFTNEVATGSNSEDR